MNDRSPKRPRRRHVVPRPSLKSPAHRRRWWRLPLLLLVLASLVGAGCGGDDDGADGSDGTDAAGSDIAGTIKIGANLELTGPGAQLGRSTLYGYRAAVAEINENGGVEVGDETYELELVECDNETNPTQGVQCAREMVEEEGLVMALAPDQGFEAAYGILERAGIVVMGSGGPASVLLAQDAEGNPRLFNQGYGFDKIVEAYFNQIKALRPEVETFAALLPNDENGVAYNGLFEAAAENSPIEYLGAEMHPAGASGDFSSFLTSLKAKDPDMAFVSFYTEVTVPAAEQAVTLDVAPVLGSTSVQPSAFADTDFRGHEFILQLTGYDDSALESLEPDEQQAFERISAASDGDDYIAAVSTTGYLGVQMLRVAIEQAGSLEADAVAQAMLTAEYDGALGPASMNPESHSIEIPLTTVVFNADGSEDLTLWLSIDASEPTETFPIQDLR